MMNVPSPLDRDECERRLREALVREHARIQGRFIIRPQLITGVLRRLIAVVRDARQGGRGSPGVEVIVDGRLVRQRLVLYVVRQIEGVPSSNAFADRLFVRFSESADGTRFEVQFAMVRAVRWLFGLVVAVGLVGEGVIVYGLVAGWERSGSIAALVGGPLFVVLGAFGLLLFSRWLGRADPFILLNFLLAKVDGHVARPPE